MQNILVTGGEHEDRIAYATRLAMSFLCTNRWQNEACSDCANCQRISNNLHPNLIIVEPSDASAKAEDKKSQSGSIKIEQIRTIVLESQKANFESGPCIFVITQMHRCTKSAANALLKVIEENGSKKILIALAPSRMTVLPTIASRLVCHAVKPKQARLSACSSEMRQTILEISSTKPPLRFPLLDRFGTHRDELIAQFEDIALACHVMLHNKELSPLFALHLGDALERANKNLKSNVNPRLVTEKLVFKEWPLIAK